MDRGGTVFVNALDCLVPERRKNKRGSLLSTHIYMSNLHIELNLIDSYLIKLGKRRNTLIAIEPGGTICAGGWSHSLH